MKITSKRGGTVRIPHPETGAHVVINQGENDIPSHVWSAISGHGTVKGLLQTGEIHLGPAKKAAAIVPAPPDDEDYDEEDEGDEQERGGTPAGVMDEIRRKEQRDADAAYEKKQAEDKAKAEADAKAAADKAEADKKSHSKKK